MATRQASTGVDTKGVDKTLRARNDPMSSKPSAALADNDIWQVGTVSTASGTDGVYVIRNGVAACFFTLSGTTLTIISQNASVFTTTVDTNDKINIYVTGGVLTVQNTLTAAQTPELTRLSSPAV